MAVKPIPEGYTSVTPYLVIKNAAEALRYYTNAFGAKEILRMDGPNGEVAHAELQIGTARIMIGEESPDLDWHSPQSIGGSPVTLLLYVQDVDKTFQRAINAGAVEIKAVQDQFYGDRSGVVRDPYGHIWNIATHLEDLTEEEMQTRGRKAMEGQGG